MRGVFILCALAVSCTAQSWDLPARAAKYGSQESDEKLKLTFESRLRTESKSGVTFGRDPDSATGLVRTRVGLTYKPVSWFKVSGMMQDSRAPWYGANAPNTVRDQADLHEAYVELFPDSKNGFGMTAGRMMLNYGEGRLLGTPQWSNLSRTYDQIRASYKLPGAQLEMIYVSPVKIRLEEFNKPVLGDRVWGMYDTFPEIVGTSALDVYVLRHDQNRPAGFTGGSTALGTDRLGVNTFGGRFYGPLTPTLKYSLEGALQSGRVGPASQQAGAWFSSLTRRWNPAKHALDVSFDYKFASGTSNPQDATHTSTFDQLYAANHDRFGHQDLLGWRNIHNTRALTTFAFTKAFAGNVIYSNFWLASKRDWLYNGSGKTIARSADGSAGSHVGQEADAFVTYKFKRFTLGGGGGYFFKGEFIQKTTPGVNPLYGYVFYSYSI